MATVDQQYQTLLHQCDVMDNIVRGLIMENETDNYKKERVGNIVMMLENTILEEIWTTGEGASKDKAPIQTAITAGRTYWKS